MAKVKLNCWFGPTEPLNTPLSLVAVCVVESLLVHVTVVPAAIVSGFGLYAVVVSVRAPETMETGVPVLLPPLLDGDVGVELLLPHDVAIVSAAAMNAKRMVRVMAAGRATPLPVTPCEFGPEIAHFV